ncbi:MAG: hypothetical protein CBE24_07900 [bacterium TMED264]|jgi:hypothetical protein|nr:MAG: hypothetical protein CBE24_07900 [bacterium TMED264]|tara:strand:- start:2571 stop:3473 length:903 start_codon:yes stop_codon:yes gene_type:complete
MLRFKEFIKEGGGAVGDVDRINQENVEATLKAISTKIIKPLKITTKDIGVLGSTGKRKPGGSSGDIDIAIDANKVLRANAIQIADELFDFIAGKAKKVSNTVVSNKGTGVISLQFPISNTDGKQKNKKVQLDLMIVDNLDLAKFNFWSPHEEQSKWKGIYRNIILSSMASVMDFEVLEKGYDENDVEVPTLFKRNFIDLKRGLMRGLQTRIGKSGKLFAKGRKQTLETKVLENQPEGIIKAILGPAFTVKDAESFESLFKILDHPKYLYRSKKKEIIKTFIAVISRSKGLVVPDEMERFV